MPLDLDNNQPVGAPGAAELPSGEPDREGAMAKADLFKLANYSHKLFQQINDEDQLESWVQAKITKAADYIASVYHYLEYEMKFSEYGKALDNSDVMSESQKVAIKNRLMEAKAKVAELKKAQAKKMDEGILSGGEQPCGECGGTGVVQVPGREVPEATKEKVRKYNTLMKASKAAHKRMDANNNGIPDDEEVEEGFGDNAKAGDTFKTKAGVATKTKTGLVHTRTDYSDEDHAEPAQKKPSKKGLTGAERRAQKSADKESEKKTADFEKKFPGSVTRHKISDKSRDPKADAEFEKDDKKEKAVDETYGQGIYEGKPSAGLSKAEKSETVKKAKKGGDIGKPGKNFKKVAAKAAEKYGSKEKGEKVAAAAMWKNIKETTAYMEEKKKLADKDYDGDGKIETGKEEHAGSVDKAIKASKKETVKESTEISRLRELTGRLNQAEKPALVENREVDQIRQLTQRLLG